MIEFDISLISEIKVCSKCNQPKLKISFYKMRSNSPILRPSCKVCCNKNSTDWALNNADRRRELNRKYSYESGRNRGPMNENKTCSSFLGVHVAERVLSYVFKNVTRMPNNNPGYDFICNNGYKIDVKSACLQKDKNWNSSQWKFHIEKNKIADYFALLAFDNREDLNPVHWWLVPGNVVNDKIGIGIAITKLDKWEQYEQPINKVIEKCGETFSE
jgi:hypothetical protein